MYYSAVVYSVIHPIVFYNYSQVWTIRSDYTYLKFLHDIKVNIHSGVSVIQIRHGKRISCGETLQKRKTKDLKKTDMILTSP